MSSLRSAVRPVLNPIKRLLYRPHGVNMGFNASVKRPFHVVGGQYISIGSNTHILPHSIMEAIDTWAGQRFQPRLEIGRDVYIGRYFYVTGICRVTIGDLCVLSEHVYITDEFHGMNPNLGPIMNQPLESKGPVTIGRSCFLGYRCVIMPGVTLGEHCIVGANSVVTKSFPAYSMVAGMPARPIKTFDAVRQAWVAVQGI